MRLHVSFPGPGFLMNDPRLVVTVDGRTLYDGSFRRGFDASIEIEAGTHVLSTAIHLGALAQRRQYELALGPTSEYRGARAVAATLRYDRMRGNFERRLSLAMRG